MTVWLPSINNYVNVSITATGGRCLSCFSTCCPLCPLLSLVDSQTALILLPVPAQSCASSLPLASWSLPSVCLLSWHIPSWSVLFVCYVCLFVCVCIIMISFYCFSTRMKNVSILQQWILGHLASAQPAYHVQNLNLRNIFMIFQTSHHNHLLNNLH